ncbi:hypothetical protein N7474_003555 [Penicillium riverlandense]|uniref:uncharacterized protein n=1 Tax=Penicillium riverlandense TaxID=1903569 RepID=UPI00254823B8|nr:uncharacterized protein N7474_003555 [Penicillium riverlandense]KAJ5826417.1 hypothetical protein N7474_003555 [Penicillium riverlandense]
MQYAYVGGKLSDDLSAWITRRINATENQPVDSVVYDTANGPGPNHFGWNYNVTAAIIAGRLDCLPKELAVFIKAERRGALLIYPWI